MVLGDLRKTGECLPREKGQKIEKCIGYKNAVRYLFTMDSTPNTWCDDVILACDEPRLDIPVTEGTKFFLLLIHTFQENNEGNLLGFGLEWRLYPLLQESGHAIFCSARNLKALSLSSARHRPQH